MRRMRRILKPDSKTVIVAFDHGQSLSVNPALDDTGKVLERVVRGGADAVIVTYGIACKYADILQDVGVIVRMDGGGSKFTKRDTFPRLLYSIEDVLKIGVDAMVCMGFPGVTYEQECMENLSHLAALGREWGLPLIAEMLPGGFGSTPEKSVDNLVLGARVGCEYGAHMIKTQYAGTQEEFRRVVQASYQPVVVLGGEHADDLGSLFGCIEKAMQAGAAGVAIGRNVWNRENAQEVTQALCALVHGGAKANTLHI